MKLTTINIIQIVAGILILVGAIIGVVYGISRPTEGDNGLLDVCWRGGSAVYDASACSSPEILVWQRHRMPLIVSAANDSTLDSAISLVNEQIGCELLRHDPDAGSEADVIVNLDAVIEVGRDEAGGATSHGISEEVGLQAYVDIMAVGDPHLRMRTIVHEFGHVLGLAHDTYESSIMFPTQVQSADLQFTRFSDGDRRLLREMYCD